MGSLQRDARQAHVLARAKAAHTHFRARVESLSTCTEKPACTSTVTYKPAETPSQRTGRGTKRMARKEDADEDERAEAKMVTAKATPRPSPRKSKALPQHQAASLVRIRYHEAAACSLALISLLWRKIPSGSGPTRCTACMQRVRACRGSRAHAVCQNDECTRDAGTMSTQKTPSNVCNKC